MPDRLPGYDEWKSRTPWDTADPEEPDLPPDATACWWCNAAAVEKEGEICEACCFLDHAVAECCGACTLAWPFCRCADGGTMPLREPALSMTRAARRAYGLPEDPVPLVAGGQGRTGQEISSLAVAAGIVGAWTLSVLVVVAIVASLMEALS